MLASLLQSPSAPVASTSLRTRWASLQQQKEPYRGARATDGLQRRTDNRRSATRASDMPRVCADSCRGARLAPQRFTADRRTGGGAGGRSARTPLTIARRWSPMVLPTQSEAVPREARSAVAGDEPAGRPAITSRWTSSRRLSGRWVRDTTAHVRDGAVLAHEVLLGAHGLAAAQARPQLAPQLAVTQHGELIFDAIEELAGKRRSSGHRGRSLRRVRPTIRSPGSTGSPTSCEGRGPQPAACATPPELSVIGTTMALRARQRGQFSMRR